MQRHSRITPIAHRTVHVSTLRVAGCLALALSAGLLAGCGGGGGTSRAVSKTPTKAVKAHIYQLQTQSLRALSQSGVANSTLTAISGGGNLMATSTSVGAVAPTAGGSDGASASAPPALPLTGQFLHNIASTSHAGRSAAIRRMQARHAARLIHGRDVVNGSGPTVAPDPGPPVTFYYDDYLGLWTDITDTATSSTYNLYVDEAKTQPAGSVTSTFPADYNTFPQTYTFNYTYTAGSQAGSKGTYTSVYNQDNSGSSSYSDVYVDGGTDKGSSTQTAAGDYTWTGRTDNADKSYTSQSGTFHADGSGSTHSQGSDGYVYDVTYRTDGSGHGRITGPDPGLPATIDWDAQGNTTVVYADGSTEYTPGWGYGDVTPVEANTTASGTVVSTTATTTATSRKTSQTIGR